MTSETKYACNLCRDAISDENKGFGVHFTTMATKLELKPYRDCHNHICEKCLNALRR